jgi:hypothetical protein
MYDTMSKNINKPINRHVVERLSEDELETLKKMVLGYGNFTKTADKAGLPNPTLRDVILRGHGIPATIKKVRKVLRNAA